MQWLDNLGDSSSGRKLRECANLGRSGYNWQQSPHAIQILCQIVNVSNCGWFNLNGHFKSTALNPWKSFDLLPLGHRSSGCIYLLIYSVYNSKIKLGFYIHLIGISMCNVFVKGLYWIFIIILYYDDFHTHTR